MNQSTDSAQHNNNTTNTNNNTNTNNRCDGTLEMLLLREPIDRLGSFGRELRRWGLIPGCNAETPNGRRPAKCLEATCSNFSAMVHHAPAAYDNLIVRTLLGYANPNLALT